MGVPFKPAKVVAALPAAGALVKSTVYFVRVGVGFDLWVTNEAGGINAYKLNAQAPDATLDAIAALDATAGILEQTGADTFAKRATGVGAATSLLTRADGDGRYATPAQVAAKADTALIGAANGIASLDATGKIPVAQIPIDGDLHYQGTWNANTNTPAIPAAAAANRGYYYKVATAGATAVDGINEWDIGDWIVSNGATWDKVDNSEKVSGVAGLVGNIASGPLTAALDLATGTLQGLMSAAQFNKLAGIAAGATANDTDANLKARANHTGTQAPATIAFANTARILGRLTAGAGTGEELTFAQVTANLGAASGAAQGAMSAADFNKLAGIAAGATANSPDATLLARANHTGTQAPATILFANTARFLARNSAGGGAGEEITGATATALLSLVVANGAQGVMSGSDKNKLDGIAIGAIGSADNSTIQAVSGGGGITPSLVASSSAILSLADAATINVPWTSFVNADVTLTANRILGNPTSVVAGTYRTILVKASTATARALTFGTNYKAVPTISDATNAKYYLLTLYAYTTTHIVVSSLQAL